MIGRLFPIPIAVPAIPIAKFSSILKTLGKGDDEEYICSVCLDSTRNKDGIRELCNCSHVFHKECLDKWVDVGQVTCPLCRSTLFPN
ncbi:hypothetical protein MANES_02G000700v8 [Manihot esculenta]|uniref:Uncharacterized protein n=1 Tax=Manihot esculenta TaxID=3983 RepID=A0ACB7I443_MANES|nr:hypothetical protein MANES_02G000700v8 [Manihot esculenta]